MTQTLQTASMLSLLRAREARNEQGKPSKLERNRNTARVRREKKKLEAEELTGVYNTLKTENAGLRCKITEKFGKDFEEELEKKIAKGPKGCLWCNEVVSVGTTVKVHCEINHPNEFRSFGRNEIIEDNEKCLQYVEELEEKEANLENMSCLAKISRREVQRLSQEEKRKRRLLKNAESARLCRQRKKFYIQKLRMKIPKASYENMVFRQALYNIENEPKQSREEKFNEESSLLQQEEIQMERGASDSALPKHCGWYSHKKRNLSLHNLHEQIATKRTFLCEGKEQQVTLQTTLGLDPIKVLQLERLNVMNELLHNINNLSLPQSPIQFQQESIELEAANVLSSLRLTK
eukprot:snap_masked-scaffold_15-processed-gene-6.21-mRNA-1 protein AED:1.00 eAED:1.00 QI:0/-1/0/0/-1/1/1/0/348